MIRSIYIFFVGLGVTIALGYLKFGRHQTMHKQPLGNQSSAGDAALQVVAWLLAIIASAGLVYGTYAWQHREVSRLEQRIAQLNKELAAAKQPSPATIVYTSRKGVKATIYTPASNSRLVSPVIVLGEVPGNWSFEASFPVKLLDAGGNVIAQAPAQLLGDWMTDKPVAFTAKLAYQTPPGGNGTLLLQKDNPSGLPANDDSVSIPIKL